MTNQRQPPIPAQFNFNDFVKVRLTDCGRDVLAIKMNSRTSAPETDADGYTKFQLWELMNVFGEHLCNGRPVPFNPNIIFLAASNPTMANQHRATDEQWHWQMIKKLLPENPRSPLPACILELRDRVEALEAAANVRQQYEAAERAEPDPAASLVDRVAQIIATFTSEGLPGGNATPAACAAIREVAASLRSDYPKREGYGTAWANLLDNEANR